jgi:Effector-associated domain 11
MMFIEKIEKLLASNQLREVIEEFLKFLNEVPQSKTDAKSDARQLRGQIIVLSGRFTELNSKINTNTMDSGAANQEKSALINSFIQILNQMPSNYPDLNTFMEEKNEEDEWKDAQQKNTIEEYQDYFNKYPNGKYKADTIKLITELEEVKNKQDSEIKRLALLEKERRENDKTLSEPAKLATTTYNQSYQTAGATATTSPAPAKSKKGLLIGLGAVAVVAIIIFFAVGKGSSNNKDKEVAANSIVTDSAVVDPNYIDITNYYFIENRATGKILAVEDNSDAPETNIVINSAEGKGLKDFEKFRLDPSAGVNQYYIHTMRNKMVIEVYKTGFMQNPKATTENPQWQLFTFTVNEEKYFTIKTTDGFFIGLDPNTKDRPQGQKIMWIEDKTSPEAQWKLIPTGDKVPTPQAQ